MKAYYIVSKVFKVLSLVAITMILANCGKSDNNGGAAATSGYYVSNNQCYLNNVVQTALSTCTSAPQLYYGYVGQQCYQVGNGTYQVAPSYSSCANSNTSGYQLINGQCYQMVNGQQILQPNVALCNNMTSGGICNGMYTDGKYVAQCTEGVSGYSYTSGGSTPWGYAQQIIVMDCSGYTLYNTSNQVVTCQ